MRAPCPAARPVPGRVRIAVTWYGTGIRVVVTVLSSEMRLINCGNPSEDKGQDIMNISKALMIVLITVGTTLLTEAVCWVLVYSDPGFAKLTTDVEKANKELRRAKERVENDEGDDAKRLKESEKRVAEGEKGVARLNARLTGMRWKTNIIMPFIMIAVFGILGEWYEGSIIAKLPFQPVGFIQGMTRRGLHSVTDDVRLCSFLPIYILGNMGLKPVITKLLGHAPPRSEGASAWERATKQAETKYGLK